MWERRPRRDLKQHALSFQLNLSGMLRINMLIRDEGVAPTALWLSVVSICLQIDSAKLK